jgi:acyl-CoA thioester hydrolase
LPVRCAARISGTIDAGVRVARLGHSSVRYEIGLFASGVVESAAQGWFVHVFVSRGTRRPVPLPVTMRTALERLIWHRGPEP